VEHTHSDLPQIAVKGTSSELGNARQEKFQAA
jgi:hypothetical protein